jgi:hypothetical protein
MRGANREEQFENAEEEFSSAEDQEVIKANKRSYIDAKNLEDLAVSPGGILLIKSLKEEISRAMLLLIETRKGRYVSDIESNLALLNKLTNAKNQTDAIASWLDSLG